MVGDTNPEVSIMAATVKIGRFEIEVSGLSLFLSVPGLFKTFVQWETVCPSRLDVWREDRSMNVRLGRIEAVIDPWGDPVPAMRAAA